METDWGRKRRRKATVQAVSCRDRHCSDWVGLYFQYISTRWEKKWQKQKRLEYDHVRWEIALGCHFFALSSTWNQKRSHSKCVLKRIPSLYILPHSAPTLCCTIFHFSCCGKLQFCTFQKLFFCFVLYQLPFLLPLFRFYTDLQTDSKGTQSGSLSHIKKTSYHKHKWLWNAPP